MKRPERSGSQPWRKGIQGNGQGKLFITPSPPFIFRLLLINMRFQSASLLASLAVMAACGTSALQLPEDFVPVKLEPAGPAPLRPGAIAGLGPAVLGPGPEIIPELQPTQPGSGPGGAHNPTGLFGLVQDEVVYRMYCNRDKPLTGDYVRHYACFETDTVLKKSLSAPNPEHLTGYINNKGTSKSSIFPQTLYSNKTLNHRSVYLRLCAVCRSDCHSVRVHRDSRRGARQG